MKKTLKNKKKVRGILPLFLLCAFMFLSFNSSAQISPKYKTTTDSVFLLTHSPHKATFLSAVVPGLGQIYNGKYWKVPIIYSGFVGLVYYANYTNNSYQQYKEAYNIKLKIDAGNSELEDEYPRLTTENLRSLKENWRRYRDLNFISIGLLYVAQILDANVDAHLFDYDISEDLTMRIEPAIQPTFNYTLPQAQPTASLGVRCAIRF